MSCSSPIATDILVAEFFIFFLLFAFTAYLIRNASDRDSFKQSNGARIRKFFLYWMSVALAVKVILISLWLLSESSASIAVASNDLSAISKLSHIHGWIRNLTRSLPNLLFLTSYLFVLGLWADVRGRALSLPRSSVNIIAPSIVGTNIIVYCIYTIMFLYMLYEENYNGFRAWSNLMVGTCYIILFVLWSYLGTSVINVVEARSEKFLEYQNNLPRPNGSTSNTSKGALYKMRLLVPVCALCYLTKGVYYTVVGFNLISSFTKTIPQCSRLERRVIWDGLFSITTEGIPCALVILLMQTKTPDMPQRKFSSANRAALTELLIMQTKGV